MNGRLNVPTSAPWAATVGYSRAVRVGSFIAVAGTAPVAEDGGIAYPGDPYRQALRCLEIIAGALAEAGGRTDDVVRTRVFLADAAHWREVGRAHGEVFAGTRPVTTFVQVAAFLDAAILVEIEADAIIEM